MLNVLRGKPGVRITKVGSHYEVVRLLTGSDEHQVAREIMRESGSPLDVRLHRKTFLSTEIVTRRYKLMFLQAMAFNIEAGMSAGRALETVVKSEVNVNMQLELTAAMHILSQGGTFSDAIDAISFFDRVTISILIAGEKTGSLRQAMQSALKHYEQSNQTSKTIFGMMGFLAFDLVTVVSTALGVQTKFIPMMEEQGIQSTDPALIAAFKDNIELGYALNGSLLWIAAVVTILASMFTYFTVSRGTGRIKSFVERNMRMIPLLRAYFTNISVADSFSVAGSMLSGGVRLNETIAVAEESTTFPIARRYWQYVKTRLMLGDTVARAMYHYPISEAEFMLLSSHRSSEQLTKVINDIANERNEQAKGNARSLNRTLVMISMAYASASVLIYLWLLWIQNAQVMQGLSG